MPLNREKLEKKFAEEYEKLDENQRLAVATIEGPVMVIAGPGTGKTQILASRVGKILLETDALPGNILCLTYTDAGVVAMRKRLLSLIGADAYKVNIHTFHAFCNEVIQENLHLFERTSLDPVSDLEKVQLFKQLVDAFPKNHPLKRYRGDVYYEILNLERLFSTMKREGWTPTFLDQKINEYVADLPNRDEFIYKVSRPGKWTKGDLKPSYTETIEKMEKLRAAVFEFERYQELMHEKKRYDFDDMINWVIKAFEGNKELLANYQEKYQYILVDEYQDTSGTQNRLVEILISYWDVPNVFVVGDDDQSIYRFQGANVENMSWFMNSYTDRLIVVLENNYRSTQAILDLAKSVITRNQERLIYTNPSLNLSKDLVSAKLLMQEIAEPPLIKEYESQREEMIDITLQVEQLLKEGVQAGRIGIIYRENKYGEELMQFLQLRNIPVYSKRSLNILDVQLGKKLIMVLKWLESEFQTPFSGDEMLFQILHFDWFGIPPIEIAKLSIEADSTKYTGSRSPMRKLLYEKSTLHPVDLFTPGANEHLVKAGKILEQLIAAVPNFTLQTLIEKVIREAGVLNQIMQSPDKHWQFQVLTAFFDFVKEETLRTPTLDLKGFIRLIELMERERISLPLVQVSGNDKGVNLMTAHGSKGLEFQYIFFAGCNSSFWEKKRKPSRGYKLPDTIFSSQPNAAENEELRRLFYVALTRAEERLFISYSKFRNDGKLLEPSMFIAEIVDQYPMIIPVRKVLAPDQVVEFSELQLRGGAPELARLEEEWISKLLDKFVMNVTALNNYLHCPLEFYFKNLIKIPSPKNDVMEYGSAVHDALEKLFRKMQDGGKEQFPSREEFIADFEMYMNRHRESFTSEQFGRWMEHGLESLGNYYDHSIDRFNKIVAIERTIRTVVKDVPIKGKLDKIEFDGRFANVVDYKTGDPEKASLRLKGPSEKDPNGGDYWRQAVFYKLLVDNYEMKDWQVISTEFDFVEPDKKKTYRKQKVLITPADITAVTEQISTTWQKIQNREFNIGCGKKDCQWCNFVKTNRLEVALHQTGEEEDVEEATAFNVIFPTE